MLLFHASLAGAGVKIGDIFALAQAESDEAVRAGEYRWEMHRPLRVGATYRVSGEFVSVERKEGRRAGLMDAVTFRIDLHDEADGELAVSTINTWIFLRST
jgi:acyl dehydratase